MVKSNRFSKEEIAILKRYRQKGMKSYGTLKMKTMVHQASTEAKIPEERVKVWITQENRRGNKNKGKTLSLNPRKPSRVNDSKRVCMSEYMTGKEQTTVEEQRTVLAGAHAEWRRAKKDPTEMNRLTGLVEDRQEELHRPVSDLRRPEKANRVQGILRKMDPFCQQLNAELGCEVAVMAASPELGYSYSGTELGRKFLERGDFKVVGDFWISLGGQREDEPPVLQARRSKTRQIQAQLRKLVTNMLNEKYVRATGVSRVQYEGINDGSVNYTVVGWPEDSDVGKFRKPGSIGVSGLRKVIQCKEQISFQQKSDPAETAAHQEDTSSQSSSSVLLASNKPSTSSGQGASIRNQAGGLQRLDDGLEDPESSEDEHVLPAENIKELETLVGAHTNEKTRVSKPPKSKRSNHVKKDKDQKRKSEKAKHGKGKNKKREQINEEFVVEKIVGHKLHSKTLFLHVKWAGCSHDDNTWEPEEGLLDTIAYKKYKLKLFSK